MEPQRQIKPDWIVIVKPSAPEIVTEMSPLVADAQDFEVVSVATDEVALSYVQRLRRAEKRITDEFEPSRKAADQAKKSILALRDKLIAPIKAARLLYDRKATAYEKEQEDIAREEQLRLQEEARKREEDKQLQDAIAAQDSGDMEEAEAIVSEPVEAPVVTVAPQVAKVSGVGKATLWSAEVTDVKKCLRFMLERDEWSTTLEKCIPILQSALRPFAIQQHEALNIPGARAVSDTSRRTRS